jgi:hypothetical protein
LSKISWYNKNRHILGGAAMTITVSVSPVAEAALKAQAAASGTDLVRYASELLEQAAVQTADGVAHPDQPDLQQWSGRSDALIAKVRQYAQRLPSGHIADDSRESIYAGRGE